jgi:6-phosphogluconolactonase
MHLENNQLVQHRQEFMKLDPGSGPRHFDFSKNGQVIFVINELSSTITSFELKGDEWKKKQTVSALPKDYKGASFCADIHVSKDGRFLYGSNRGHNSIAVFEIEEKQKLTNIGFVPVEGDWPRNFALSPDGKFMLVANQKSGNITVFKVDKNTGMPEFTGKEIKLPGPVCIEFLQP